MLFIVFIKIGIISKQTTRQYTTFDYQTKRIFQLPRISKFSAIIMKLIAFAFILILRGNATKGSESDVEYVQNVIQALLNRIATLEERLDNSEKSISELKKTEVLDIPIEDRVEKLEQMSKYKTLRSCQEMSNRGVTLSGLYDIDPDGEGIGHEPIKVYCDFNTGSTQILHDKEDVIKIEKCDQIGCAVYELNYLAPKQQIEALMSLSESCYQDLDFGCFMAPLRFDEFDHGFWTDKDGNAQAFFNGNNPGLHTCKCGEDQSCLDPLLACNCDAKSPVWALDSGRITAKDLLPIQSFSYGPLIYDLERANVTIGRLICSGTTKPGTDSVSCNSLKLDGIVNSGIYALQDENQAPRLGYCDMSSGGYLNDLERSIGFIEAFKDPGRIFFSVFTESDSTAGSFISFDGFVENTGNYMDIGTGIFTCPFDGLYEFSFSATSRNHGYTLVDVQINGKREFDIYTYEEGNRSLLSYTWIFRLAKDDQVQLKLIEGAICSHRATFSGQLIKLL